MTVLAATVVPVGAEGAEDVLAVVREAFGARPVLDPPADASAETVESVRVRLAHHGGLLASLDGRPVGALVFDPVGDTMFLRRFGVVPTAQGRGVARVLVDTALQVARERGAADAAVVAREELPETIRFWERQGFAPVVRHSPYVELRRSLAGVAPDAEAMRALGAELAGRLRAGDLVLLVGELGAGKTTFTQGLGEGLGVRGPVTSPTFVIARVHPSEVGGPALVHVDAYRLGGLEELDDLDLDASLDEAVTVVEWGEGIAEGLAESRLEVRISRGDDVDDAGDDESRTVTVTGVGPRWEPVR
ncbi:tRNA (adenosine(37)-N6)-threonylcarbamoyltransferase complex ATPase subunit type 1 TsaE [Nocardioides dilutus]